MTTVRTKDGFAYTLTEEDFLWIGRAAAGEGGDPRKTIWAWFSRFIGLRVWRERLRERGLAYWIQAHSQPVNPRWLADGEFCRPGGRNEGSLDCRGELLARRTRYRALHPSQFPLNVLTALAALRAGTLHNPIERATDFAVCSRVHEQIANGSTFRIVYERGTECYVSLPESRAWPSGFVFLKPSFWPYAIGGFAIGAAALGGYLWWSSR